MNCSQRAEEVLREKDSQWPSSKKTSSSRMAESEPCCRRWRCYFQIACVQSGEVESPIGWGHRLQGIRGHLGSTSFDEIESPHPSKLLDRCGCCWGANPSNERLASSTGCRAPYDIRWPCLDDWICDLFDYKKQTSSSCGRHSAFSFMQPQASQDFSMGILFHHLRAPPAQWPPLLLGGPSIRAMVS